MVSLRATMRSTSPPMVSMPSDNGITSSSKQVAGHVVARELMGLDGGAQGHHFVGVQVRERFTAKKFSHGALHLRHARGATHHDDALHFVARELGVAQRAAHHRQRARREFGRSGIEIAPFHVKSDLQRPPALR